MSRNLQMASEYLEKAIKKRNDAKTDFDKFNFDDCVSNSQESIEFSVKAIFYAFNINPPKKHEFEEDDFRKLLESMHEGMEPKIGARDLVEPYVYFKFWSPAYLIAKYGLEKLGVGGRIFGQDEAQLAIKHADTCWSRASVAVNVYGPKLLG